MGIKSWNPGRFGVKQLGLGILAIGAVSCTSTPQPIPVSSQLSSVGDCTQFAVSVSATVPNAATLAEQCLQIGQSPDANTTQLQSANAAHNAAKLFAGLAERSSDASQAAALYAKSDSAAKLSTDALSDSRLNGLSGVDAGAINAYKMSRAILQISAKTERGLAAEDSAAASCGGQAQCLRDAEALFGASEGSVFRSALNTGDANALTQINAVRLLNARGASRLAELEGDNGGVERAIQKLRTVISTAPAGSADQSQAANELSKVALLHAKRVLKDADSTTAPRQAVGFLTQAIQSAGYASQATYPLATLNYQLGNAHMQSAGLRGAADGAGRMADLCNAAAGYKTALSASGPALSAEKTTSAQDGVGIAYAGLWEGDAECAGQDKAALLTAGLSAFDGSWANGTGPHSDAAVQSYVTLLLEANRNDEAGDILAASSTSGVGEGAMNALLRLAKIEADKNPNAVTREAEKLYEDAAAAYAESPRPELAIGVYYYKRGRSTAAETSLLAAKLQAEGNPDFAAENAKANYYLSRNESDKSSGSGQWSASAAVEWAESAVLADSTKAKYHHQACRAHLLLGEESFASGKRYCEHDRASPDGALLQAMMQFREAQITRIDTPTALTIFRTAEQAFQSAQSMGEAEAQTINWPGVTAPLDLAGVAKFGGLLSRACGTPVGEQTPIPSSAELATFGPFFETYGLYLCNEF
ncbi:MAG: hypothetical protein AAF996_03810 [Pseudomonadota bacterium]